MCNIQYTGKYTTKLQSRICNHRSYVGNDCFDPDTDEAKLAKHLHNDHNLNSVDLFNSNYSFTILELGPRNIDFAEQKWANRLMTPFGLNKEKPGGFIGSTSYMCRRLLISRSHSLENGVKRPSQKKPISDIWP